ncbi:hypothetical protein X772_08195 [Mesorhizobium sp. LSJC280B00]|nr:hypothetical protein X772_08195 [Mesorhizobium sp. LSJC280B00]
MAAPASSVSPISSRLDDLHHEADGRWQHQPHRLRDDHQPQRAREAKTERRGCFPLGFGRKISPKNYKQLEAFRAVMEAGTVTGASEHLHIA